MSSPNHRPASSSSSKSKNSHPNKSKSKRKPVFLQPGLEGYLVVIDETVEVSGSLINELFSFFEQFSSDLLQELTPVEGGGVGEFKNLLYGVSTKPQSLLSDESQQQQQPVININDNIRLVEDLKKETDDANASEEIGHEEDELNHNILKLSMNDTCIIDDDSSSKNNESSNPESIPIKAVDDQVKDEAGGSPFTIKSQDGQQSQNVDGGSLSSPQEIPKKITILTRPTQVNHGEEKLSPRKVSPRKVSQYSAKTTPPGTANRSVSKSSPNQSPLLPIPVPRELVEIANNYDAAQDGRSPNTQSKVQMKRKQFYLLQSKTFNMPKPQLKFERPVINDDSPFVPKLPIKPNAKVPLNLEPKTDPKTGRIFYDHPYTVEIDEWIPPPHMMTLTPYDWPLTRLRDTQYHLVQSHASLQMMMRDLTQVHELAFDVEHSDRSFFGLTCIIQISTRFKDYIVDCFTLRDHLHCLNTVFTDPNILKVAHNATGDVINLQRDFGIYIVGLFDTSEAAKVLTASKRSVGLAALLSTYLNVETDKKYQLADWRIRPIPLEMVNYARTDTHFLLKLYDILKGQLLSSGTLQLLSQCYTDSKDVCRLRYEKPPVDHWVSKFDERFSNQQKYALTELNKWRNRVAREEDDGVGHIASHKILSCLAETLPKTSQDLLNALKSGTGKGRIPEFMERDMQHILKIFETARFMPLLPKTKNFHARRVVSDFLKTRISHFLFFKAKTLNPVDVVYNIMKNQTFVRPNYIQLLLPVVSTCERELTIISRELHKMLINYQERTTFGIFLNNFPTDMQIELVSCIKHTVAQIKPFWTYTDTPVDVCIVAFGVDRLCCLSIVNNFVELNGYKM